MQIVSIAAVIEQLEDIASRSESNAELQEVIAALKTPVVFQSLMEKIVADTLFRPQEEEEVEKEPGTQMPKGFRNED